MKNVNYRRKANKLLVLAALAIICCVAVPDSVMAQRQKGKGRPMSSASKSQKQTTRKRGKKAKRALPSREGVLVETEAGQVLLSSRDEELFNPASGVKLATALGALHTFGADYRYPTFFWTNGPLDSATGILKGDLFVDGSDPVFRDEHARAVGAELNARGIQSITGNLYVSYDFSMNKEWSGPKSGAALRSVLKPFVTVSGVVRAGFKPATAHLVLRHRSAALKNILKVMLCYSDNFIAERIGRTLGGPGTLEQILVRQFQIPADQLRLETTSGLGVNRVSVRAMMRILRALRNELAKSSLDLTDIMAVAAVDPGTLAKRYTTGAAKGSVIAKTGTLITTDAGASALVGAMRTGSGETLLFVILHMHGRPAPFRLRQDALVTAVQKQHGGAAPFPYQPLNVPHLLSEARLETRLSLSDILRQGLGPGFAPFFGCVY